MFALAIAFIIWRVHIVSCACWIITCRLKKSWKKQQFCQNCNIASILWSVGYTYCGGWHWPLVSHHNSPAMWQEYGWSEILEELGAKINLLDLCGQHMLWVTPQEKRSWEMKHWHHWDDTLCQLPQCDAPYWVHHHICQCYFALLSHQILPIFS